MAGATAGIEGLETGAAVAGAAWWRFGRAVTVPTVAIVEATLPTLVAGPGTVQARVPVTLASRITATVSSVAADVGDAVRAGAVLVTLDDRDPQARQRVLQGQRAAQQRHLEAADAALEDAPAPEVSPVVRSTLAARS